MNSDLEEDLERFFEADYIFPAFYLDFQIRFFYGPDFLINPKKIPEKECCNSRNEDSFSVQDEDTSYEEMDSIDWSIKNTMVYRLFQTSTFFFISYLMFFARGARATSYPPQPIEFLVHDQQSSFDQHRDLPGETSKFSGEIGASVSGSLKGLSLSPLDDQRKILPSSSLKIIEQATDKTIRLNFQNEGPFPTSVGSLTFPKEFNSDGQGSSSGTSASNQKLAQVFTSPSLRPPTIQTMEVPGSITLGGSGSLSGVPPQGPTQEGGEGSGSRSQPRPNPRERNTGIPPTNSSAQQSAGLPSDSTPPPSPGGNNPLHALAPGNSDLLSSEPSSVPVSLFDTTTKTNSSSWWNIFEKCCSVEQVENEILATPVRDMTVTEVRAFEKSDKRDSYYIHLNKTEDSFERMNPLQLEEFQQRQEIAQETRNHHAIIELCRQKLQSNPKFRNCLVVISAEHGNAGQPLAEDGTSFIVQACGHNYAVTKEIYEVIELVAGPIIYKRANYLTDRPRSIEIDHWIPQWAGLLEHGFQPAIGRYYEIHRGGVGMTSDQKRDCGIESRYYGTTPSEHNIRVLQKRIISRDKARRAFDNLDSRHEDMHVPDSAQDRLETHCFQLTNSKEEAELARFGIAKTKYFDFCAFKKMKHSGVKYMNEIKESTVKFRAGTISVGELHTTSKLCKERVRICAAFLNHFSQGYQSKSTAEQHILNTAFYLTSSLDMLTSDVRELVPLAMQDDFNSVKYFCQNNKSKRNAVAAMNVFLENEGLINGLHQISDTKIDRMGLDLGLLL